MTSFSFYINLFTIIHLLTLQRERGIAMKRVGWSRGMCHMLEVRRPKGELVRCDCPSNVTVRVFSAGVPWCNYIQITGEHEGGEQPLFMNLRFRELGAVAAYKTYPLVDASGEYSTRLEFSVGEDWITVEVRHEAENPEDGWEEGFSPSGPTW